MPYHEFRLITGTQQLQRDDDRTLADLGITHLSRLVVTARFVGGDKDL